MVTEMNPINDKRSDAARGLILYGPLAERGVLLTRYQFRTSHPTSISDHYQNGSLILLLNISGNAYISSHSKKEPEKNFHLQVSSQKIVSLVKKNALLLMQREADQKHHFLILEISTNWLSSLLKTYPHPIKKEIIPFLKKKPKKTKPILAPFCLYLRSVCEELFLPHHQKERPELWFYSKILELISHTLLEPLEDFCTHRKERLALERIESVKKNLAQNLENPPSLQECARNAGCSSSYLSRTFTLYTGMTISRYLRNSRLESAATLLRSGKYNVTEASMAVGYSSLSHFSKAFGEMFGCCPCTFGFHSGISSKEGIGAITASPKSVSPR